MKIKYSSVFLLCAVSLSLSFFVSCRPAVSIPTGTATSTSSPISITDAPPADVTVTPLPGDLGLGKVHGRIIDGITGLPIAGATLKCEHVSYTSPSRCSGIVTTNAEGLYVFENVFFHDTDRITLL